MLLDNMLTIPGYVLYRHDRRTLRPNNNDVVKKGGGVAAYIREDTHVDSQTLYHLNQSNEDIELQCLLLRPPLQKRFLVLNIYRPPSGNFQLFLEELLETLEQIVLHNTEEIVALGNFNIDLTDPQSQNALYLVENLQHYGLLQTIEDPTRHGKNSHPSLIDHVYTNSKIILESGNITLNISDHDLIYIIRKKEKSHHSKLSFKGRSYRNYDREVFQENLEGLNWDEFYNSSTPDQAWNILRTNIQNEIEIMCPIKDIKISKQKDPWITEEILELINDKNDLLNEAKRTQNA